MGKIFLTLFATAALISSGSAQVLAPLHAELAKKWPVNRAVNIVFHGHSVPAGDAKADMANPADVLTQRADLIRKIAASEKVILADVSAAWLAELAKGKPQNDLSSQGNHPNLRGHQLAADAIMKVLAQAGL